VESAIVIVATGAACIGVDQHACCLHNQRLGQRVVHGKVPVLVQCCMALQYQPRGRVPLGQAASHTMWVTGALGCGRSFKMRQGAVRLAMWQLGLALPVERFDIPG
jgi:hypothetical protein